MHPKPLSTVIMLAQRFWASHCYLRFQARGIDRELIYQASGMKVNFCGGLKFNHQVRVMREFEIELSDETYKRVMQFCVDHAQDDYGVLTLLGIGYVTVASWFGRKVANPWPGGVDRWVCSRLVAILLRDVAGLAIHGDVETMGPKEINAILEALPGARIIARNDDEAAFAIVDETPPASETK
jgi:hypothetical protein